MNVLGLDPGFRKIGYSIVDVSRKPFECIDLGLIQTTKANKKLRVRSSDDDHRCTKEITRAMVELCKRYDVKLISAETISLPPNVVSALQMARVWGVISAVCEMLTIPMAEASPKIIKKVLCGRLRVKDSELQEEVLRRYPEIRSALADIAKSNQEHVVDSLGAVEACADSEVFMTLRRLA